MNSIKTADVDVVGLFFIIRYLLVAFKPTQVPILQVPEKYLKKTYILYQNVCFE